MCIRDRHLSVRVSVCVCAWPDRTAYCPPHTTTARDADTRRRQIGGMCFARVGILRVDLAKGHVAETAPFPAPPLDLDKIEHAIRHISTPPATMGLSGVDFDDRNALCPRHR
eukprot:2025376-Prymnesium_polylepis.1